MTAADHARLAAPGADVDAILRELHTHYHDSPLAHVAVHRAWIRVELSRRRYLRAAFHAFAGYIVAAPASLLQRHTGLVVPAFRKRYSSLRVDSYSATLRANNSTFSTRN